MDPTKLDRKPQPLRFEMLMDAWNTSLNKLKFERDYFKKKLQTETSLFEEYALEKMNLVSKTKEELTKLKTFYKGRIHDLQDSTKKLQLENQSLKSDIKDLKKNKVDSDKKLSRELNQLRQTSQTNEQKLQLKLDVLQSRDSEQRVVSRKVQELTAECQKLRSSHTLQIKALENELNTTRKMLDEATNRPQVRNDSEDQISVRLKDALDRSENELKTVMSRHQKREQFREQQIQDLREEMELLRTQQSIRAPALRGGIMTNATTEEQLASMKQETTEQVEGLQKKISDLRNSLIESRLRERKALAKVDKLEDEQTSLRLKMMKLSRGRRESAIITTSIGNSEGETNPITPITRRSFSSAKAFTSSISSDNSTTQPLSRRSYSGSRSPFSLLSKSNVTNNKDQDNNDSNTMNDKDNKNDDNEEEADITPRTPSNNAPPPLLITRRSFADVRPSPIDSGNKQASSPVRRIVTTRRSFSSSRSPFRSSINRSPSRSRQQQTKAPESSSTNNDNNNNNNNLNNTSNDTSTTISKNVLSPHIKSVMSSPLSSSSISSTSSMEPLQIPETRRAFTARQSPFAGNNGHNSNNHSDSPSKSKERRTSFSISKASFVRKINSAIPTATTTTTSVSTTNSIDNSEDFEWETEDQSTTSNNNADSSSNDELIASTKTDPTDFDFEWKNTEKSSTNFKNDNGDTRAQKSVLSKTSTTPPLPPSSKSSILNQKEKETTLSNSNLSSRAQKQLKSVDSKSIKQNETIEKSTTKQSTTEENDKWETVTTETSNTVLQDNKDKFHNYEWSSTETQSNSSSMEVSKNVGSKTELNPTNEDTKVQTKVGQGRRVVRRRSNRIRSESISSIKSNGSSISEEVSNLKENVKSKSRGSLFSDLVDPPSLKGNKNNLW